MTRTEHLAIAVTAGTLAGLAVLGVGGRIAMRIVAYTTPEPQRFTLAGTLRVIGVGTGWGAITAPILIPLQTSALRNRRWLGLVFGAIALGFASLPLLVTLAFGGRLVAPVAFIVASAGLFSGLFLAHGAAVVWLVRHWAQRIRSSGIGAAV